jgi:tetratricopeptide (TPR) repeat protein
MGIKEKLKTILQEAEIYRSQGLMAEARAKYADALRMIQSQNNITNKSNLLGAIDQKIRLIDDAEKKVEKVPASPELSKKAQDLIKNLFAFSENRDEDAAALEGAVVLAKFGQFDRALQDFNALLPKENVRVEAAKNILRCHLSIGPAEEAVNQYHQWFSSDIFLPGQLETIRSYLEDILKKRGIEAKLPSVAESVTAKVEAAQGGLAAAPEAEEEFLDITSIGITFESGPYTGKMVEFDVNFQSGNMLSLIISKKDQELIDGLKAGMKLKDVQFFSPIAIFNGAGVVSSITQIRSGPKQGDHCLDIRIVSS